MLMCNFSADPSQRAERGAIESVTRLDHKSGIGRERQIEKLIGGEKRADINKPGPNLA